MSLTVTFAIFELAVLATFTPHVRGACLTAITAFSVAGPTGCGARFTTAGHNS
jgi:hypothetical protein